MPLSTSPRLRLRLILPLLAIAGLGLMGTRTFSETNAPAQTAKAPSSPHLKQVPLQIGNHIYQLEKAVTPEQEEKGLMYRTHLAERHGMLFPFNPPRPVRFWMKNTQIPLDMVFFSQEKVLYIQHAAPPCLHEPCPTYGPDDPVDMVVELPAGTAQKHHIGIGTRAVPVQAPHFPKLTNQHE